MRIEAVTVCVNYAGELAATAPFNAPIFDRWVIITDPDDERTRRVCRRHHLQCITSSDHARNGDDFNKGRMVERGLQHLSKDCWRLHLDADIALPTRTRAFLDWAHLDEAYIYGCDRIMCNSAADWNRLLGTGFLNGTLDCGNHSVVFPPGFTVGTRWARPDCGYVPIGFFQLWHSLADEDHGYRIKPYPTHHGNACRTDTQHALQWDRRKRVLIPELIAVHLATSRANGINWNGRRSPPFGEIDAQQQKGVSVHGPQPISASMGAAPPS